MKSLRLLAALAVLGSSAPIWAQPINSLPTSKKIKMGDENAAKLDTYNALNWYMKAHEDDPNNTYVIAKIAKMHEMLRDYVEASSWYGKLVQADKDKQYPLARFTYGQVLKMNGQHEKAITELRAFVNEYKGEDAARYTKLANIEIEGAQYARQHPEPFEKIVVENLGPQVNTPSTEGTAFPLGRNRLIYSSLRSDTIIFVEEVAEELRFARIYETNRTADGKAWEEAKPYNVETLNKKDHHLVHPAYSPDMKLLYFTYATLKGNMVENSQIYVADYSSGTPSNPRRLDFNSDNHNCRNPQVALFDGKMYLLFTSNMSGGKGGYDIWYAEINPDGTTKQPLNLSPQINSLGDDVTPFFDERDNTLYFSSNGHPSIGGLDIFKAVRSESGEWSKVENMGQGFNSVVDDFGFIINKVDNDDCYGYMVSNRKGTISLKSATCCDDLFSVLMPSRCDVIAKVNLTDETTGTPLKGATVELIDKETGQVVEKQTNPEGNNFTFVLAQNKNYEFRTSKPEYEPSSLVVATTPKEIGEITQPIELGKATAMRPIPKGLMVEVYDAETQKPLSGANLSLMDAVGKSEIAKQNLGQDVKFLFPAIDRKQNYRLEARREGYQPDTRSLESAQINQGQVIKVFLTPLKLPMFYNVYYDFNQANIRPSAEDTLKMVLKTLQDNPKLIVEVRGHTDAIGGTAYNNRLSARRAQAAISYLTANGIEKDRLVLRAFGKMEPVAENTVDGKDNPEGRQLNRRVEFKVIDAKDIEKQQSSTAPKSTTGLAEADKKKS